MEQSKGSRIAAGAWWSLPRTKLALSWLLLLIVAKNHINPFLSCGCCWTQGFVFLPCHIKLPWLQNHLAMTHMSLQCPAPAPFHTAGVQSFCLHFRAQGSKLYEVHLRWRWEGVGIRAVVEEGRGLHLRHACQKGWWSLFFTMPIMQSKNLSSLKYLAWVSGLWKSSQPILLIKSLCIVQVSSCSVVPSHSN